MAVRNVQQPQQAREDRGRAVGFGVQEKLKSSIGLSATPNLPDCSRGSCSEPGIRGWQH